MDLGSHDRISYVVVRTVLAVWVSCVTHGQREQRSGSHGQDSQRTVRIVAAVMVSYDA